MSDLAAFLKKPDVPETMRDIRTAVVNSNGHIRAYGYFIKEHRVKKRISMHDLSEATGISTVRISDVTFGRAIYNKGEEEDKVYAALELSEEEIAFLKMLRDECVTAYGIARRRELSCKELKAFWNDGSRSE